MDESGKAKLKRDWTATQPAFQRFLEWLDEGHLSNGERYLETQKRLVRYFERKNCLAADELADETLNRVVRRLDEEGAITNVSPAQYCYTVAKFVFLEHLRQGRAAATTSEPDLDSIPARAGYWVQDPDSSAALLECLDHCLRELSAGNRELILEYYQGELGDKIRRRRQLAGRLRLTTNALSIRACRIREELEACTRKCSGGR